LPHWLLPFRSSHFSGFHAFAAFSLYHAASRRSFARYFLQRRRRQRFRQRPPFSSGYAFMPFTLQPGQRQPPRRQPPALMSAERLRHYAISIRRGHFSPLRRFRRQRFSPAFFQAGFRQLINIYY